MTTCTLLFVFASNRLCPLAFAQSNTSVPPSRPAVRFVYYRAKTFALGMDAPTYKNIYSVTSEGVAERQLTEDNHSFNPVLSPDGTKVAYLHIKADTCEGCLIPAEYEIYVMNADGTDAHFVASINRPMTISWSPDANALAYGGFPVVSDAQGRVLPEWSTQSNTGGSLALDWPIYHLQLDSASRPRLLTEKATGALDAFKWSSDGKWITYSCRSPQEASQRGFDLCLSGTGQKAELRILPESAVVPEDYSWSPDGTQLAYSVSNKNAYTLSVVGTDGSAPCLLTASKEFSGTPRWSPDGRQIAFAEREGSNSLIYAMNADGSSKTRLTKLKLRASNPMWSPDGKRIVFTALVHGNPQVHLMNADGSQVRTLTRDRKLGCRNIAWLGESNLLLLRCGQPTEFLNAAFIVTVNEYFYLLAADDLVGRPRRLIEGAAIGISFAPNRLVQDPGSNSSR
jgi:Tol biopolymer transport system component